MAARNRLVTTTTLLLDGLDDESNQTIWQEFDERYRPIILGFARSLGLDDSDAADVAQETLARFVRAWRAGQYDRSKGRLRSWLIGIARFRIADQRKARAGQRAPRGSSAIDVMPDDETLDSIWEGQRRQAILRQAVDELRSRTRLNEKTIRAFEMLALSGRAAADVAGSLGMTLDDVYQAKNRVAGRLREIVEELERVYEE